MIMKRSFLKIYLFFILYTILYQSIYAQLSIVDQLPELINLAQKDSIQKIERLAALKFHKLINIYRLKNNLDTIGWDEGLWLTCRNHNIWMATNSELSHNERKNTKMFFGETPADRYEYTTLNKGKCSWSGENALFFYEDDQKNINEIALDIASKSFEIWKNSEGHNQNMLSKNHKVHGVSFCLMDNLIVWGTDLFSFTGDGQFNVEKTPIVINQNSIAQKTKSSKNNKIVDIQKIQGEILKKLYSTNNNTENNIIKKNKAMEIASNHHSLYMSSVKQLTHLEIKNKRNFYGLNTEKRMIKATHGLYYLLKHKIKLIESIAILEIETKNLDIDNIVSEIQTKLNLEQQIDINYTELGYGIVIKRNKSNLKLYVTRIVRNNSKFNNEKIDISKN
jgi:uncharacterized protein YkwD